MKYPSNLVLIKLYVVLSPPDTNLIMSIFDIRIHYLINMKITDVIDINIMKS